MGKNKPKWSLKERLERKERRKKMGTLLGFLVGPYLLAEMTGRAPKIPPGYPDPESIGKMNLQQMEELKPQLQKFMNETGGPDLLPEEKHLLQQFASLNPKLALRR